MLRWWLLDLNMVESVAKFSFSMSTLTYPYRPSVFHPFPCAKYNYNVSREAISHTALTVSHTWYLASNLKFGVLPIQSQLQLPPPGSPRLSPSGPESPATPAPTPRVVRAPTRPVASPVRKIRWRTGFGSSIRCEWGYAIPPLTKWRSRRREPARKPLLDTTPAPARTTPCSRESCTEGEVEETW